MLLHFTERITPLRSCCIERLYCRQCPVDLIQLLPSYRCGFGQLPLMLYTPNRNGATVINRRDQFPHDITTWMERRQGRPISRCRRGDDYCQQYVIRKGTSQLFG